MNEQVFETSGVDGLVRRGVVSLPSVPARVAVVLLPAGLKYRIGPHRLNVVLARRLAAAGYLVLRFDPLGIGESDGSLAAGPVQSLWTRIMDGLFVDDTLLVCAALRERYGVGAVVAAGLCGGAISAQLAAARAPELIQGVVSFGAAVRATAGAEAGVSEAVARHHLRSYLKKLRSGAAWARVLRGESDLRGIVAYVWAGLRGRLPGRVAGSRSGAGAGFLDSFRVLRTRGTPHLLVFGTGDNRWLEFEDAVLGPELRGQLTGRGYDIRLIADANHELHLPQWKAQALQEVERWMHEHFPPPVAAAAG